MEYAIELEGVSKHYSEFSMDNMNLRLPVGEIMGLVGVNGAGKSTTIRMIMGLVAPDAGRVSVMGCVLPEQQIEAKYRVGYASEDVRLYKRQTLAWHMHFMAQIFHDWDQKYADHLVSKFDLKAHQKLAGFSHGQRVKAILTLQLARRPKLLVLDEPTTGLDPIARSEVLDELAEVLRDEERSVLFSSHNTADIELLADTISFIHEGKVLASQDTESFVGSWQCIRGHLPNDRELVLPFDGFLRRSGTLCSISSNEVSQSNITLLQAQGLEVLEVKRMSLEEIFIATVRKEKANAN